MCFHIYESENLVDLGNFVNFVNFGKFVNSATFEIAIRA